MECGGDPTGDAERRRRQGHKTRQVVEREAGGKESREARAMDVGARKGKEKQRKREGKEMRRHAKNRRLNNGKAGMGWVLCGVRRERCEG
jgi:hypothetical protein